MQFTMEAQALTDAVFSVIKALPQRAAMPVLEGIFVEAKGNSVRFCGTDLMLQKESLIPASVEEEGECLLPGKLFCEIVRKLPQEHVFFAQNGNTLTMRCGRSVNQIQCLEYDEYPQMSFESSESFSLTVNKADFQGMINRTVFAVSTEESRPVLTGVFVEMEENTITMVATDSFQFAKNMVYVEQQLPKRSFIVPGKTLQEIGHMLDGVEDKGILTFSRTHIMADMDGTVLVARLLDGNYIDYRRLMPKDCKCRVLVDKAALVESLDRATLVAREGNNMVRLSISSEAMQIKAASVVGKLEDEIHIQLMGEELEIGFNPKYLLNVCKAIPDEKMYMEMNTSISPCSIKPVNGESFFFLVVPMRML